MTASQTRIAEVERSAKTHGLLWRLPPVPRPLLLLLGWRRSINPQYRRHVNDSPIAAAVSGGAMNFLKLLTIGTRKGRVRTLPELATAIGEGAAFLVQ